MDVKLFSSDLNNTLTIGHTMNDLAQIVLRDNPRDQKHLFDVFRAQTDGKLPISQTLRLSAHLSSGLTLEDAVNHSANMDYVDGLGDFLGYLKENDIKFVVNTTGYSVTFYGMREKFGRDLFSGFIGNRLVFAFDGDERQRLREDELESLASDCYLGLSEGEYNPLYKRIRSNGEIRFDIRTEEDKLTKLLDYSKRKFPEISTSQMVHMGDSMGDFNAILGLARLGGFGVAFNYNAMLGQYLSQQDNGVEHNLFFVDELGGSLGEPMESRSPPSLAHVVSHVLVYNNQ